MPSLTGLLVERLSAGVTGATGSPHASHDPAGRLPGNTRVLRAAEGNPDQLALVKVLLISYLLSISK